MVSVGLTVLRLSCITIVIGDNFICNTSIRLLYLPPLHWPLLEQGCQHPQSLQLAYDTASSGHRLVLIISGTLGVAHLKSLAKKNTSVVVMTELGC